MIQEFDVWYAGAYAKPDSKRWHWVIEKCPFCRCTHVHDGGPIDRDPRLLLGAREPHCDAGKLPKGHESDYYWLTDNMLHYGRIPTALVPFIGIEADEWPEEYRPWRLGESTRPNGTRGVDGDTLSGSDRPRSDARTPYANGLAFGDEQRRCAEISGDVGAGSEPAECPPSLPWSFIEVQHTRVVECERDQRHSASACGLVQTLRENGK